MRLCFEYSMTEKREREKMIVSTLDIYRYMRMFDKFTFFRRSKKQCIYFKWSDEFRKIHIKSVKCCGSVGKFAGKLSDTAKIFND